MNDKVDSGYYNDKKRFPLIDYPTKLKVTESEMEKLKEEYIETFCCVKYPDDNNLYIDAHY